MNRDGILVSLVIFFGLNLGFVEAKQADYPVTPVSFTDVKFTDSFWQKRLETNRKVTIEYDFQKCRETGRLSNFAKAAGREQGEFEGIYFNDSDVFKVIEGAAYSLSVHADAKLEQFLDDLIDDIAGAQEDDGYLYTIRTINPDKVQGASGKTRWSNLRSSHELYNVGHMYEASVAYYQATGKRQLLDVSIKNADLLCSLFGQGKKIDVPGHQEIEIGLVKLYRVTGHKRYLDLAKFYLDMRGRDDKRQIYGAYCQDHKPVTEQTEAVGHAVRAGYMYSGMADVAAMTGDPGYIKALNTIWENVVHKKIYLTGGIGARHGGEAFGDNYELPNASAYNETCAAIANALWNYRMFLIEPDAKYIDVFEHTIYNGFLAGISMEGNTFFYPNPLACDGKYKFNQGSLSRQHWFGCSCCPVNIVRFIPSLPGYVYATKDKNLYANMYVDSTAMVTVQGVDVEVIQKTEYPWSGKIRFTLNPKTQGSFSLNLRIPGWARGQVFDGDLYSFGDTSSKSAAVSVNGRQIPFEVRKGYAVLSRRWDKGDVVELNLPMPVRRVLTNEKVIGNVGRAALTRGPIVYCAEGIDNSGNISNLMLADAQQLVASYDESLLGGMTVIQGSASAWQMDSKESLTSEMQQFKAIPYYAWNHRGAGEMAVWIANDIQTVKALPSPTLSSTSKVTASYCYPSDSVNAINDQSAPANSNDHSIARLTFWSHTGTEEWVQYDFKETATVKGVSVYFFDDEPQGGCRVPASWKVYYKSGSNWKLVKIKNKATTDKDRFNTLDFEAVATDGLRIKIQLQKDYSGGILECKVVQ